MGWPQYVVMLFLGFRFVTEVFKAGRDRELSSGVAAAVIFIIVAYFALIVGVLHAGGFW